MIFLLDTHALLWAMFDDHKLSQFVRAKLEDSDNSIIVSSLSFWEISMKYASGKLELNGFLPEELPNIAVKMGFDIISLSSEHASTYNRLTALHHKDPFDRMLIWQAIKYSYTFITKDERVKGYTTAGLKVLW